MSTAWTPTDAGIVYEDTFDALVVALQGTFIESTLGCTATGSDKTVTIAGGNYQINGVRYDGYTGEAKDFTSDITALTAGQTQIVIIHINTSETLGYAYGSATTGTAKPLTLPADVCPLASVLLTVSANIASTDVYNRVRFYGAIDKTHKTVTIYNQGTGTDCVLSLNTSSGNVLTWSGGINLGLINAATTDTDKFLVSDGGEVKFRTGAQLWADILVDADHTHVDVNTGGTVNHSAIANPASGDDHTQYVHNTSARTISAQHNFTNAGAPFNVTSTTKVTTLNVDQVDGFDLNQGVENTDSPTFVAMTLSGLPADAAGGNYIIEEAGVLKYRTAAEVLADIGATGGGHTHTTYMNHMLLNGFVTITDWQHSGSDGYLYTSDDAGPDDFYFYFDVSEEITNLYLYGYISQSNASGGPHRMILEAVMQTQLSGSGTWSDYGTPASIYAESTGSTTSTTDTINLDLSSLSSGEGYRYRLYVKKYRGTGTGAGVGRIYSIRSKIDLVI